MSRLTHVYERHFNSFLFVCQDISKNGYQNLLEFKCPSWAKGQKIICHKEASVIGGGEGQMVICQRYFKSLLVMMDWPSS